MSVCKRNIEDGLNPLSTAIADDDESTPLLQRKGADKPTPLPLLQMTLIILLQHAESLTFHMPAPFTPSLVRETGVTGGDETKVAFYTGILQSSFFLGEGLMVFAWGRISDRIGRKPVFMIELFGVGISILTYGLSKSYSGLLASRFTCGALNGGIGVMKSMIAEITDSTNIARAFSLTPISWTVGGTVGPLIGGYLSHPSERYPSLFGNFEFLKTYPYLLPCSIPAIFAFVMIWVTYHHLNETVPNPQPPFRFLLGLVSPRHKASRGANNPSLPFSAFLTSRILICAFAYAMVAVVDIAIKPLLPVFYTTPLHLGGLGFDTATVGICMASLGIVNTVSQFLVFPHLHNRLGGRNVFLLSAAASIPVFALFPIANYLAIAFGNHHWVVHASIAVMCALIACTNMSYGCIAVYTAAASPDSRSMGATNGIVQTTISFTRAVAPSLAGSLYSFTIKTRALGGWLVWDVLLCIGLVAVVSGLLLPRTPWARAM